MLTLIFIGLFVVTTCTLLLYGLYVLATRRKAIVTDRLKTYANIEEEAARATAEDLRKQSVVERGLDLLAGQRYLHRLEENLAATDIPMKPTEYILLRLALAAVGFVLGLYGLGYLHSGLALAIAGFFAPAIVVRVYESRRRAKFVRQLADALMLLTNSLRSGYSFIKGLELVAKEMDDPISKELSRMLREINLGATLDEALTNLGRRVQSADLDIVIGAYLVQKDVGGNLTEIMEKVAETIRERLRIQGDIRVLTAQGRLSGLIVGLLPLGIFTFLVLRAPDYYRIMFEAPKIHLMGLDVPVGVLVLLGGLFWQILGGLLIVKIISIKV